MPSFVGAFLIQAAIAQMNPGVIQLNHVGVAVAGEL